MLHLAPVNTYRLLKLKSQTSLMEISTTFKATCVCVCVFLYRIFKVFSENQLQLNWNNVWGCGKEETSKPKPSQWDETSILLISSFFFPSFFLLFFPFFSFSPSFFFYSLIECSLSPLQAYVPSNSVFLTLPFIRIFIKTSSQPKSEVCLLSLSFYDMYNRYILH